MTLSRTLGDTIRLLAWLGLGLIPSLSNAALCTNRPIRLAFFETPVLYSNGKGLDKDFVDELQLRSKCRFETVVMPRARVWQELEDGQLDMTTSVLPTPEREKTLWLLHYFQIRMYLVLSKAQAGHIKSLEAFLAAPRNLVFAQVRGYKHGEVLDAWIGELAQQGRVHEVVRTENLYKMLELERIAAIAAPSMTYKAKLQEHALLGKVVVVDWGGRSASSPRGLGLSKRSFSEAQAREWQALIDTMQRDGTMRRLIGRYLDAREAEAMLLK